MHFFSNRKWQFHTWKYVLDWWNPFTKRKTEKIEENQKIKNVEIELTEKAKIWCVERHNVSDSSWVKHSPQIVQSAKARQRNVWGEKEVDEGNYWLLDASTNLCFLGYWMMRNYWLLWKASPCQSKPQLWANCKWTIKSWWMPLLRPWVRRWRRNSIMS